jgi:hypothetical protein
MDEHPVNQLDERCHDRFMPAKLQEGLLILTKISFSIER